MLNREQARLLKSESLAVETELKKMDKAAQEKLKQRKTNLIVGAFSDDSD